MPNRRLSLTGPRAATFALALAPILALLAYVAPPARAQAAPPKDAMIVKDITPGKKGGRLVIAEPSDPKTFNPVLTDDDASSRMVSFMGDQLYGYDQFRQENTPSLAKSWEYNADQRTWTFHLREGLEWSDGAPLTADDFLFYVQVIRDEKVPSTEKEFMQIDGKPFEFSAPDPLTLAVKIPVVNSFALMSLGLVRPLPRHKLEKALKAGTFAEAMGTNSKPEDLVCSGPFVMKEFKSGEKVVLKANPHYYRFDEKGTRLPYIDELVILNVGDVEATALRFQAGDTDLLESIQPSNLPSLEDGQEKGNYKVVEAGLSVGSNHFWFNLKEGGSYNEGGKRLKWQPAKPGDLPPADILAKDYRAFVDPKKRKWFENDDFRKACSMAVNRSAIVKTVLFGKGKPLYGPISPSNQQWHNSDVPKFPYDVKAANALLDKIGFAKRGADGVRLDAEGNPLAFTIVTNKENNVREKVGVLLKEDLKKIGLGANVQTIDFNDLITRLSDSNDYEGCLLGMTAGVPPHPAMGKSTWLSSGRMHQWNPSQKSPATAWEGEIDGLYGQLQQTFDEKEQQKIHAKMQVVYCEHQPMIHLFATTIYVAAKNRLGNLKPSVLSPYLTHNLPELYFKD